MKSSTFFSYDFSTNTLSSYLSDSAAVLLSSKLLLSVNNLKGLLSRYRVTVLYPQRLQVFVGRGCLQEGHSLLLFIE